MRPFWLAYIIGGHYRWGWRPNIVRHALRYFREDWRGAGYSFTAWMLPNGKSKVMKALACQSQGVGDSES